MTLPRRTFVTNTARAAAGAALVATLPRAPRWRGDRPEVLEAPGATTLYDPQVKALALSAVEAARGAGAAYADVRITYTNTREIWIDGKDTESEQLGLSIRALVDGYWGWAATSYLAASEAPRVAQAAVGLAKGNAATRQPRHVEWTSIPVVTDGTWTTPVREDPFQVAIPELMDWVTGMSEYIEDCGDLRIPPSVNERHSEAIVFTSFPETVFLRLSKQERVFASTEGSYLTQTTFVTDPHVGFRYRGATVSLPIRPAQIGYEYVIDTPWQELIRQGMDRVDEKLKHPLPQKHLDIGRYDIIFSASAMATLVGSTLGTATQVDRALGYEANASGTSYLGPDPLAFLGTQVASPLVTVTADRIAPQALATTRWDEEGIRSEAFPLVQDGLLVEYQTTREQAAWLAPYYHQRQRSVHSHGCAAGTDALTQPMQHTPNMTLQPGKETLELDDLVASLDHGLVVEDIGDVLMDFQALNGLINVGEVTEVRHGKRVARVGGVGMGVTFHSPEFWKNVIALGGAKSVEQLYPMESAKGEPEQRVEYSVSAVPALIKQVAVIDFMRKA